MTPLQFLFVNGFLILFAIFLAYCIEKFVFPKGP